MSFATRSKLGWPLILFFSFIPLIMWVIWPYSFDQRFVYNGAIRYELTMTAIGQVLGLVGMAMFALNLVLGARLRWLEGVFGGMNKVYIAHHILGGLSFVLLLLHPLFLIGRYFASGMSAVAHQFVLYIYNPVCFSNFSLTNPDCATNFGMLSLSLMILFLVLTFFVKLPYHIWKWTHKFLGVAFFFGSLHAITIPSDVTTVKQLQYYMFFLVSIGFLAILYRTLLGFLLVSRLTYTVDAVRIVNASIVEIVLSPKDPKKAMKYIPGQFVFIGFPDSEGLGEVHPFSLSSGGDGTKLTIGIKALGDFTGKLKELKVGARAVIEGPFGRTSYAYYPRKEQIWIAGGIGVTPFLGMARSLKNAPDYKVDMYYSALSLEEAAFNDELVAIAAGNPNFKLIPWYGKEKGFLSADAIIKESEGVLGKELFICGPPGMMAALKSQFSKIKVPVANVHSEEFSMLS